MRANRPSTNRLTRKVAGLVLSLAKGGAIIVVYVAVGRAGRQIDSLSEEMRVFFPQSGVALSALMLLGVRYWPAVAIGSWLNLVLTQAPLTSDAVMRCLHGESFLKCLFTSDPVAYALAPYVAAGNTLSAAFGAQILRRFVAFERSFSRIEDGYRFLAYAVLLAPMISASLVTYRFVELLPSARATWLDLFWKRWLGHALSNLIVTPIFLVWSSPPRRRWSVAQIAELVLLLTSLVAVGLFVFTRSSFVGLLNYPVSYAPFPLILWAALRFGARGAASASLIISVLAVFGISQRAGPFARQEEPLAVNIALLQIYLLVVAMTGLLVGAASTERRHAMEALARSQEELRRLAAQLDAAREEERAHLARELHDELAQLLAGIRIGVRQLAKRGNKNDAEFQRRLDELTELTNQAVTSMRHLATSLRPGILDDLGLVEAIRWQCAEFTKRFGIPVFFEPPKVQAQVPTNVATALFRVLQESLTNIAKHARANNAVVHLGFRGDAIILEICDDGIGLTTEEAANCKGLGIIGMRERVAMLGGEFSIGKNEAVGRGTVVRALVRVDSPEKMSKPTQ